MPGLFKRAGRVSPYVAGMSSATTIQGELWSTDPEGWATAAEGRILPLYERVLETLQPLPGSRLLDAGCGTGLFAELAVRSGAHVIGLDAARGLVEHARRRHPMADYVVEDLERMPFDAASFDVVTAFNSVLYAHGPRRALAEIARVVTPRGSAVITVGVGPEQAESAALVNPLARPDHVPDISRLDLADEATTRAALLDAGFASVTTNDIAFDVDYPSEDDAIDAQLPAGPVVAAVRHSGRTAVEEVLRSFFIRRARADGTVRMGVVFRCYFAERSRTH
jgi:SAM-dependent methyltransferase